MVPINDLVFLLTLLVAVFCSASAERNHRYPAAVFARGKRKSRSTSADRSHVDARFGSLGDSPGSGVERDVSWTHAAFRSFHEMRAGRLPPVQVAAFEGDSVVQVDHGQFRDVVRKFTSMVSRSPRKDTRSETESEDVAVRSPAGPTCWHLRGRLTNTATGRTIALVEGVELSRSLAFEIASRDRKNGQPGLPGGPPRPKSGELELDKALRSATWSAFGALATSKFFMYQDLKCRRTSKNVVGFPTVTPQRLELPRATGEDIFWSCDWTNVQDPETGEPMETYRSTPVDKKQPVRTYERFSQVVTHILKSNGRILLVSEWGGRSVKAETVNSSGVEEIGGATASGRGMYSGNDQGANPRRVFNLQFFVEARTAKEEREMKRRQSRPGPKWIAFGSTPPRSHGCREAYTYVNAGHEGENSGEGFEGRQAGTRTSGLMSYTRFGECPSWYGIGRTCSLDLQGRRVDSFASLPSKLKEKVLEVEPGFDVGPPTTLEECRALAAEEREAREGRRRRTRTLRRPFGVSSL